MDGDGLKIWRLTHKLSQAELASHLATIAPLFSWTRDSLYNREAGRAPMPEGMSAMLDQVEQRLAKARATAYAKDIIPYGSKRLSMVCQPISKLQAEAMLEKGLFWKYDDMDPKTGHPLYNLFQMKAPGRSGRRDHCTYIRMDAKAWHAFEVASNSTVTVAKLNAWFDQHRARLEQTPYAMLIPDPSTGTSEDKFGNPLFDP